MTDTILEGHGFLIAHLQATLLDEERWMRFGAPLLDAVEAAGDAASRREGEDGEPA